MEVAIGELQQISDKPTERMRAVTDSLRKDAPRIACDLGVVGLSSLMARIDPLVGGVTLFGGLAIRPAVTMEMERVMKRLEGRKAGGTPDDGTTSVHSMGDWIKSAVQSFMIGKVPKRNELMLSEIGFIDASVVGGQQQNSNS